MKVTLFCCLGAVVALFGRLAGADSHHDREPELDHVCIVNFGKIPPKAIQRVREKKRLMSSRNLTGMRCYCRGPKNDVAYCIAAGEDRDDARPIPRRKETEEDFQVRRNGWRDEDDYREKRRAEKVVLDESSEFDAPRRQHYPRNSEEDALSLKPFRKRKPPLPPKPPGMPSLPRIPILDIPPIPRIPLIPPIPGSNVNERPLNKPIPQSPQEYTTGPGSIPFSDRKKQPDTRESSNSDLHAVPDRPVADSVKQPLEPGAPPHPAHTFERENKPIVPSGESGVLPAIDGPPPRENTVVPQGNKRELRESQVEDAIDRNKNQNESVIVDTKDVANSVRQSREAPATPSPRNETTNSGVLPVFDRQDNLVTPGDNSSTHPAIDDPTRGKEIVMPPENKQESRESQKEATSHKRRNEKEYESVVAHSNDVPDSARPPLNAPTPQNLTESGAVPVFDGPNQPTKATTPPSPPAEPNNSSVAPVIDHQDHPVTHSGGSVVLPAIDRPNSTGEIDTSRKKNQESRESQNETAIDDLQRHLNEANNLDRLPADALRHMNEARRRMNEANNLNGLPADAQTPINRPEHTTDSGILPVHDRQDKPVHPSGDSDVLPAIDRPTFTEEIDASREESEESRESENETAIADLQRHLNQANNLDRLPADAPIPVNRTKGPTNSGILPVFDRQDKPIHPSGDTGVLPVIEGPVSSEETDGSRENKRQSQEGKPIRRGDDSGVLPVTDGPVLNEEIDELREKKEESRESQNESAIDDLQRHLNEANNLDGLRADPPTRINQPKNTTDSGILPVFDRQEKPFHPSGESGVLPVIEGPVSTEETDGSRENKRESQEDKPIHRGDDSPELPSIDGPGSTERIDASRGKNEESRESQNETAIDDLQRHLNEANNLDRLPADAPTPINQPEHTTASGILPVLDGQYKPIHHSSDSDVLPAIDRPTFTEEIVASREEKEESRESQNESSIEDLQRHSNEANNIDRLPADAPIPLNRPAGTTDSNILSVFDREDKPVHDGDDSGALPAIHSPTSTEEIEASREKKEESQESQNETAIEDIRRHMDEANNLDILRPNAPIPVNRPEHTNDSGIFPVFDRQNKPISSSHESGELPVIDGPVSTEETDESREKKRESEEDNPIHHGDDSPELPSIDGPASTEGIDAPREKNQESRESQNETAIDDLQGHLNEVNNLDRLPADAQTPINRPEHTTASGILPVQDRQDKPVHPSGDSDVLPAIDRPTFTEEIDASREENEESQESQNETAIADLQRHLNEANNIDRLPADAPIPLNRPAGTTDSNILPVFDREDKPVHHGDDSGALPAIDSPTSTKEIEASREKKEESQESQNETAIEDIRRHMDEANNLDILRPNAPIPVNGPEHTTDSGILPVFDRQNKPIHLSGDSGVLPVIDTPVSTEETNVSREKKRESQEDMPIIPSDGSGVVPASDHLTSTEESDASREKKEESRESQNETATEDLRRHMKEANNLDFLPPDASIPLNRPDGTTESGNLPVFDRQDKPVHPSGNSGVLPVIDGPVSKKKTDGSREKKRESQEDKPIHRGDDSPELPSIDGPASTEEIEASREKNEESRESQNESATEDIRRHMDEASNLDILRPNAPIPVNRPEHTTDSGILPVFDRQDKPISSSHESGELPVIDGPVSTEETDESREKKRESQEDKPIHHGDDSPELPSIDGPASTEGIDASREKNQESRESLNETAIDDLQGHLNEANNLDRLPADAQAPINRPEHTTASGILPVHDRQDKPAHPSDDSDVLPAIDSPTSTEEIEASREKKEESRESQNESAIEDIRRHMDEANNLDLLPPKATIPVNQPESTTDSGILPVFDRQDKPISPSHDSGVLPVIDGPVSMEETDGSRENKRESQEDNPILCGDDSPEPPSFDGPASTERIDASREKNQESRESQNESAIDDLQRHLNEANNFDRLPPDAPTPINRPENTTDSGILPVFDRQDKPIPPSRESGAPPANGGPASAEETSTSREIKRESQEDKPIFPVNDSHALPSSDGLTSTEEIDTLHETKEESRESQEETSRGRENKPGPDSPDLRQQDDSTPSIHKLNSFDPLISSSRETQIPKPSTSDPSISRPEQNGWLLVVPYCYQKLEQQIHSSLAQQVFDHLKRAEILPGATYRDFRLKSDDTGEDQHCKCLCKPRTRDFWSPEKASGSVEGTVAAGLNEEFSGLGTQRE